MFGLNVIYRCKEGKRDAFLQKIDEIGLQKAVLAEAGCVQYHYFRSADDENKVLLLEKWESRQAQADHLKQPHMSAMGALREEFLEDTVLETYDLD